MLRLLEFQVPYASAPEDELDQATLGLEISSCKNIATLVLDPVVRPEDLVSISQRCNLISVLSLGGFTLSDSISKSVLEAMPLLAYLSFYGISGLCGLSWLRHQRLKRAEIKNSTWFQPGVGNAVISEEDNTLDLIGEFLPALQEFSIWSHHPSPQDFRPRRVTGLPAVRQLELRACRTIVLRDLPHLRVRHSPIYWQPQLTPDLGPLC